MKGYQENHAKLTWVGGPDGLMLRCSEVTLDGEPEMMVMLVAAVMVMVTVELRWEMACSKVTLVWSRWLVRPGIPFIGATHCAHSVCRHTGHTASTKKRILTRCFSNVHKKTLQYLSC